MLLSTFSPGAWPSLYVRQVGSHDCPFGACSGFTLVAACELARPPFEAFCLWASSPGVTSRPRQIATEGVDFLLGRDFHPLVKCTFTAHAHTGHMSAPPYASQRPLMSGKNGRESPTPPHLRTDRRGAPSEGSSPTKK
jgi:hypothetical protein